jgi:hypothetical protein
MDEYEKWNKDDLLLISEYIRTGTCVSVCQQLSGTAQRTHELVGLGYDGGSAETSLNIPAHIHITTYTW